MEFAPPSEALPTPTPFGMEVILLCRGKDSLTEIQLAIAAAFPGTRVKGYLNPDELAAALPVRSRAFIILEFAAIASFRTSFANTLKDEHPDAWVTILADPGDLPSAFGEESSACDDFLKSGVNLPLAIQESQSRRLNRQMERTRRQGFENIGAIPLLAVADQLPDALLLVDGDGVMIFANRAWCENFPNPASGRTYLSDVVHPNDINRLEAELQLAILEHSGGRAVIRVKSLKGEWETLQTTIAGIMVEGVRAACVTGRLVTEYHKARTRATEAERRIHLFELLADEVIYRFDPFANQFHYVSNSAITLTGYSDQEWAAEADRFFDLIVHPDDLPLRRSILDAAIRRVASSLSQVLEYRITKKDGALIWVEERILLEWSRDGRHHWMNGVLRDVTSRKQFQEQHSQSELENRRMLDEMLAGYLELETITSTSETPDFIVRACNATFENRAGLAHGKLAGQRLSEVFPALAEMPLSPSDGRSLHRVIMQVLGSGETEHIHEYYWPHLHSYYNLTIQALGFGGVSLGLVDVTLQKQAELRLEAVLHGLPDTALYQTGGGIEYVSPGIEKMLGYPPELFTRSRDFFPSLIHPDDHAENNSRQQAWHNAGAVGVVEMEFRARRRDGEYIWILDRMSKAFTTPDGKSALQGVMINITDRKTSEAQILHKSQELELLFRALPDIYFRLSDDGVMLDFKTGSFDDLYVPPESFLGKRMDDVLPKNIGKMFQTGMKQLTGGRQVVPFEYELPVPSGLKTFEARMFRAGATDIAVLVRDITHAKEANALREKHHRQGQEQTELLRKLNSLSSPSEISDAAAHHLLKQKEVAEVMLLLGDMDNLILTRSWSNDKSLQTEVGKWIEVEPDTILAEAIAKDKPISFQPVPKQFAPLVTARKLITGLACYPLQYADHFQGLLCIAIGIRSPQRISELTEEFEPIAHLLAAALDRSESNEAVDKSRAFLNAIFDLSPIPTWLSDASGRILRVNTAWEVLFKATLASARKRGYSIMTDPVHIIAGHHSLIAQAFKDGNPVILPKAAISLDDFTIHQTTGTAQVDMETALLPIRDASGRVTNVIVQYFPATNV